MEDPFEMAQDEEENQSSSGEGKSINLRFSQAGDVQGERVTIRMGLARSAKGGRIQVRQGGILQSNADRLDMVSGAIGMSRTRSARLTASASGAVLAQGDVTMDQSVSRLVVSNGDVRMDQSVNAVILARNVQAENSGTVFLFAQNLQGNVQTMFGPRESIMFGAVAGIVAGAILLVARMFRRKK